jgi:hypothetical protein
MSVSVQVFSNKGCCPVKDIPTNEHSSNFQEAVSEMVEKAGKAVSFLSANIAIIPLAGDLRLVVMG